MKTEEGKFYNIDSFAATSSFYTMKRKALAMHVIMNFMHSLISSKKITKLI